MHARFHFYSVRVLLYLKIVLRNVIVWNINYEWGIRKDIEILYSRNLIDHFSYYEMEYIDDFSSDNVNVPCRFMYWCGQYCCYLLDNRGKSRLNCVVSRCMCVKMLPCCCYEVRSNWQRHATSIATIPSSYALRCVALRIFDSHTYVVTKHTLRLKPPFDTSKGR